MLKSSPQAAPVPRLFTLGLCTPAFSTRNSHVRKGRSQRSRLFQERWGYKPQASSRQRGPEPVKLPQRSPVPEGSPQECSLEGAPMLECFSQEAPAETPQEEPVLANFPEGEPLHKCSPCEAPMPKLFTLGISVPVLSTKKYRLHKHQASLTHRIRLPVITAEKSLVPESTSLDEAREEAMELYRSSSNKAAKALKDAPMPECSPQEGPMPKLFTLGISIPVLSTEKYRLHKYQASLTHRTRLPIITAEVEPMLVCSPEVEPMHVCSPEVEPMLVCSPEDESEQRPQRRRKNKNQRQQKGPLRQRELKSVKPPHSSPMLECYSQEAPMPKCSPQAASVPRLFTLGLCTPTFSTRNSHVRKGRSQRSHLFQERWGYKPQPSSRQRGPEPVKLPQRSPVPEGSPQECSSEEAPMLECFSQEAPAETPQEEAVLANFPEGEPLLKCSPREAPMPKLFTLGISVPVLSTKKYRLHKHQASLTHRIRLPVITAEKSLVPESTSLDEAREEAMELYRSSSNKAAKALKEAPMPECSPQEGPMPKLFTLGISIPVLSTKKHRLHKYQASLTHRTRLPIITAERTNLSRGLKEGGKTRYKGSR
ncbi:pollen-specific leucine-rich repeat extensin 1 [Labeo rohita]|uniref:Pollen-specific leucine-rich repeat extensin 1 n=1 Tax=Labeo rohita TaxID=84645 RepID=A0A498NJQ4_LABRO|nr:pollen-specific leucine-rich repeat extensin 1 [Labeo rohita]